MNIAKEPLGIYFITLTGACDFLALEHILQHLEQFYIILQLLENQETS